MESAPTLEPTMRADRIVDAALVAVVLALFVAAAFGLTELPGGEAQWEPVEWKGVHDAAKGLILPLLALRIGLSLDGNPADRGLRNRVWMAMGLCWIGDIALTFSGDLAFLIGLVSFLLGHACFVLAFRHHVAAGAPRSTVRTKGIAMVALIGVLVPTVFYLWGLAGELGPAIGVYAAVIATMAYFSWVLGPGPGVVALRIGAVFFMGSDLILAFGRFGEAPLANGHFWVMSTYIVAQVALALGFTAAAGRPGATHP